ncbi:MAG: thioester reductase domain-containing protein, partial [Acidobacteriota bacterium]
GERLYRTGDLGRYLADGKIEFLGRLDQQIKLRGFRIEPAEIENTIKKFPGICNAIVVLREDGSGNSRLVAYCSQKLISTAEKQEVSLGNLRNYLKERLPDFMVPYAFILLDSLPLLPNGKVDRAALPSTVGLAISAEKEHRLPRNSDEEMIAQIWIELLQVDEVGIDEDFFELGGHSLLAAKLIHKLREAFQVQLPLRVLFEVPTILGLARAIELIQQGEGAALEREIDLSAEAVLDDSIYPELTVDVMTQSTARILLTGASGFLGAFLLSELLEQTQAEIYCLVRTSDDNGLEKISGNLKKYLRFDESDIARIIPLPGDLSRPLLGLSKERFHHLAGEIDAIYHNGALINASPYAVLKKTNVLGTQEVLRLASRVKVKPVHYISTLDVFASTSYVRATSIHESDDIDQSIGLFGGYAQSKWVAEKLVTIAGSRGIPVYIYRPGSVTGHSQTGAANTDDLISRLMIGCVQLGSVPDIDMMFDLTPIDYVSKAIVCLSRHREFVGRVFHLVNPQPIHLSELATLAASLGVKLRLLPYQEWRANMIEIVSRSPKHILYPLLSMFTDNREGTEPIRGPKFECEETIAALVGSGIVCPAINERLISAYLLHFIEKGLLDASLYIGTDRK